MTPGPMGAPSVACRRAAGAILDVVEQPSRRPAIATLIYGLLLVAMAVGQLADVAGFADILGTYDVFGAGTAAAAVAIIFAELTAGAGLLASRVIPPGAAKAAGRLGVVVAMVWATLAVQAFARGLAVPTCGCFGVHLGQPLRWWVLLEDVYMLVLAWYAAIGAGVALPGIPLPRRGARGPAEPPLTTERA